MLRRVAYIVLLATSVGLKRRLPLVLHLLHTVESLEKKLLLPKSDAFVYLLQISGEIFLLYVKRPSPLNLGDDCFCRRSELDKILVLDWRLNLRFNEYRLLERNNHLLAWRTLLEFRVIDHR